MTAEYVDTAQQFRHFHFPPRIHTPIRITLLFFFHPCTSAMPCLVEGVVDRDARDEARCGRRQRVPRWSAGRRRALRRGPRAPGPPLPSKPWVPEARRAG